MGDTILPSGSFEHYTNDAVAAQLNVPTRSRSVASCVFVTENLFIWIPVNVLYIVVPQLQVPQLPTF